VYCSYGDRLCSHDVWVRCIREHAGSAFRMIEFRLGSSRDIVGTLERLPYTAH